MKKYLIAAAVALASMGAQAQVYGELGVTFGNVEVDAGATGQVESSPKALRGILGFELNKNVAIEGMLGFGLGDDSMTINGTTYSNGKVKIESAVGFYVKPKIELAPQLELFGRFGFADVSINAKETYSGYSETGDDSGISYGAGLTYRVDKKFSISADYMTYISNDDVTATGFTIGLGIKF